MDTTYDVTAQINMPLTSSNGPGDADVNTKKGRSTRVSVGWNLTRRTRDGRQGFDVSYWCEVAEQHKDYTRITNGFDNKLVGVDCDPNVEIVSVPEGGWGHSALDLNWTNGHGFSRLIHGKQHDWVNWSAESFARNAGFTRFFIRIDGPGDDQRGNCRIDATLKIPVTTRPKQIAGASPFKFEMSASKIFKFTVADRLLQEWRGANPGKRMMSARKSTSAVMKRRGT